MIRLIFLLVIVAAVGYGGLAFYYQAMEPCDMLAQEAANQQADMLGVEADSDGLLAGLNRMGTSNMSRRECVDELWRAWFDG